MVSRDGTDGSRKTVYHSRYQALHLLTQPLQAAALLPRESARSALPCIILGMIDLQGLTHTPPHQIPF